MKGVGRKAENTKCQTTEEEGQNNQHEMKETNRIYI